MMRLKERILRRRSRPDETVGPPGTGRAAAPALRPPSAADLQAWARRAESERRLLEAVDLLRAANLIEPDPDREAYLVALRHLAFEELADADGRSVWPPVYDDLTAGQPGLPTVTPDQLSSEVLGSAIVNHGALHVTGLAPTDQVRSLVEGIDRAFAARDASLKDGNAVVAPWFVPFRPSPGPTVEGSPPKGSSTQGKGKEAWRYESGTLLAADSPRGMFAMLETFAAMGLGEVIGGYLGERPAVSVRKCSLRRVPAGMQYADWHQDGAFLGADVRSVNVWLALTTCGGSSGAPGLDILPRRVDHVLETGTDGAIFPWSVGPGMVDKVAREMGAEVVRPHFQAGDALLFDDVFLHRTGFAEGLTTDRYAIESWFFAPSTYPTDQVPLVF